MSLKDIATDSFNIMRKELLELTRNRLGLVLMILMPFLMMIMFGFIYPNNTSMPEHLPVGIIDKSHTGDSAAFIGHLQNASNSSVKMDFVTVVDNDKAQAEDTARDLINQNKLDGAIIIPADFTADETQGKSVNVTVLYDNSNPQIGAQVLAEASGLINGVGGMKSAATVYQLGVRANETVDPGAVLVPYKPVAEGTIPGSNYFDFLAPGLLMMIVMMSAMTGIPEGISQEKERGTFDGVLSSPINPVSIIIGKSVALTIQGFIQGILIFILAVVFFGVHVQGSILLAFGLLFLGVFSFIGLGILFTSISEDQKTSTLIANLLMFPMMFVSGIMFPVEHMPWFMQWLSAIMPVTYAADAMRKVMIMNAGLQDVLPQIAILIGFGVVTMAIAIPVFKRSMTR
ncbi:MAG TPA: ABC transporter permease [Methanocella sp.]|nr:ABC transporter permease [Methanocella sp.]